MGYSGLVPSENSSGNRVQRGGITKTGNGHLRRLHKRYKAMASRGKNKNQVVTAVGRELLGFIWAIGIVTEKQQKLANAA